MFTLLVWAHGGAWPMFGAHFQNLESAARYACNHILKHPKHRIWIRDPHGHGVVHIESTQLRSAELRAHTKRNAAGEMG